MVQQTKAIVLRSIKYGETSLITTLFTHKLGIQAYLIKGIRTNKTKQNRAALFQPASLLDIVAYQKPQKNLQHLREYQSAHIYQSLQEEVIKNSIALFSSELLLRLLPEHAPLPDVFDFSFQYFRLLDELPAADTPNFPIYFIVQISRLLGYELNGKYTVATPYLHLHEGGFSAQPPVAAPLVPDEDVYALAQLLKINTVEDVKNVSMNAHMRFRLLDWYIEFLHSHTQHMDQIKSLPVLRAILH